MAELEAAGYTYETLYESAKLKSVLDHLYVLGTEGVTVTDEEVKAAFDAKVEAQKAAYDADLDAFISAYISEEDILYTPEGLRLLHCIFIALEDGEAAEGAVTGLAKAEEALAKNNTRSTQERTGSLTVINSGNRKDLVGFAWTLFCAELKV